MVEKASKLSNILVFQLQPVAQTNKACNIDLLYEELAEPRRRKISDSNNNRELMSRWPNP